MTSTETPRTIAQAYRLPSDCTDQRWYVLSPSGSCVATAATKAWANELAVGFMVDMIDDGGDYLVVDTKGLS